MQQARNLAVDLQDKRLHEWAAGTQYSRRSSQPCTAHVRELQTAGLQPAPLGPS